MFPVRFEYVLGLFIALKKQFEDEEKERKKQEDKEKGNVNIDNYMGQANTMMNRTMGQVHMPSGISMPSGVSMPSIPH